MICKVCGRTIMNEAANFCEYCGASFRPGSDNKVDNVIPPVTDNPYTQQAIPNQYTREDALAGEQPISFRNWMAILILPFIPYIGAIVFVVILIFWAVKKEVPATRKNFARAMLVVCVLMLVYMIAIFTMLGTGYLDTLTGLAGSLIHFIR